MHLLKYYLSLFITLNATLAVIQDIHVPENVEVIPNQYIITMRHSKGILGQLDNILDLTRGIKILRILGGLNTYIARVSPRDIRRLKKRSDVQAIEADHKVYLSNVQRNAPWGLARLTNNEPSSLFNDRNYEYNPEGGSGVTVYVLDSGIDINHREFEGRARWGKSFVDGVEKDDNGHGTHVAGTIGSKTYGVAKKVNLVAVKVFSANGVTSNSNIIAGIDWIVKHSRDSSVINMSFSSSHSNALNKATQAAIKKGIVIVVASGNQGKDGCFQSPGSVKSAITVGATTKDDTRAPYSNYGFCVNLFAPGDRITSTWPKNSINTLSGTSMATPHVSGLAALIRSDSPDLTPAEVSRELLDLSQKNRLSNLRQGSPDKLAHTDGIY